MTSRAVGFGVLVLFASLIAPTTPSGAGTRVVATAATRCPWVAQSRTNSATPDALAREVVARMSLTQKADFAVLAVRGRIENANIGVASLCVPDLTLSDGPNGVGSAMRGVTQFPAEIAMAASFDPRLESAVARAMGAEALTKGFDVLQGPNLNLDRVPASGRVFETFGEDPALTSAMGVAAVRAIQSVGVMANAKHFTGYTQETARGLVNQVIAERALAEIYNVPFEAAVRQAHVASIMCAMGSLNGINTCSSPYLYATLRAWGFTGFVRSDYQAVRHAIPAYAAGMDLIKPGTARELIAAVRAHRLAIGALDHSAVDVLRMMFAFHLFARPRTVHPFAVATSSAHARVALRGAEGGVVLLKNAHQALPLVAPRSIAVIGVDAQSAPVTSGGGSSTVKAPYVITPLSALRATFARRASLTYTEGGPRSLELDQVRYSDLLGAAPLPGPTPIATRGEPGKADLVIDFSDRVTLAAATASTFGRGDGWSRWSAHLRVRASGTYEIGMQHIGDTFLSLDGRPLLRARGLHGPTDWATTVHLVAGRRYHLAVNWYAVSTKTTPKLGITNVSAQIHAAVLAAKRAAVAIVFAGNFSTEGADQPNLYLQGDSNALIEAVAKANAHTIVVLNTGGAVYMPWLSRVAAVVEAWYPGQMDGAAIAAVLSGAVDPSGRLPVSFPLDAAHQPATSSAQFPGVNAVVQFTNGLDVGYRWYQAHHVRALFPFGFGLSYTHFTLTRPTLTAHGLDVTVTVTNTGPRAGADVVQAYVHYPAGSGEPPEQLRAFTKVALAPHQSRVVTLTLPSTAFAQYVSGRMTTLSGTYRVDVGSSSADLPIHLTALVH